MRINLRLTNMINNMILRGDKTPMVSGSGGESENTPFTNNVDEKSVKISGPFVRSQQCGNPQS